MPADLNFAAMGTDAHVIVVGGPAGLTDVARRRIADLEQRWSRFLPDSEVSRLNRAAGTPVRVSPETRELVERAIAAWELTGGLFDPTVLGALVRAGYDRPFVEIEQQGADPGARSTTRVARAMEGRRSQPHEQRTGAIVVTRDTVCLPAGTGFDPGGLGKGLAADIVVDELRGAGALGVSVNLGGDLRVDGTPPVGDAWTIAVEHPWSYPPIGRIGLKQGATATSTTLRRRWEIEGEARHHLIDPTTGEPSASDLTFVTVVAGYAWAAEIFTKAALLRGTPHHFNLLETMGADALAVDEAGRVYVTPGMSAYLAYPPEPAIIFERDLMGVSS